MSKSDGELEKEWQKRFKEWDSKALTPSNIFAYTFRNDTTMVLQTSAAQPFIIDRALAFISGSLLVYAETVIISESVTFPGKKLGIFCNNLALAKPDTAYSLGVTGYKGNSGTPDGSNATDGGDGGELVVYVEEAADNIFPNIDGAQKNTGLFLHANGGDGGKGKNHVTQSGAAGNGGKGGKGGNTIEYQ
ncbi:hypothetical protein AA313_de0204060 [Arthrobotrys entomopaga]|nr:hypothetical protein AA313_de0204060 [Arthrobotrys entomopaga]